MESIGIIDPVGFIKSCVSGADIAKTSRNVRQIWHQGRSKCINYSRCKKKLCDNSTWTSRLCINKSSRLGMPRYGQQRRKVHHSQMLRIVVLHVDIVQIEALRVSR